MTLEARKSCLRRLYEEVWNAGNLDAADELFTDDYRGPMPDVPPGPEGEKRHIAMIRRTFPDVHLAIEELVAEGDTVMVRGTMTGTDRGGFMGRAPSGRRVSVWGVHSFRFEGDRIAACWVGMDMLGLLIQLGVVASPWPAERGADGPGDTAG